MGIERILIVDDSATSRMIIKRCFDMTGYFEGVTYAEAEDGLKAVAYLQDNTVDLVVTDLKMPKMDGGTFIKKLKMRDTTKDLPVVIISSMGNDVTEEQFQKEGVRAIIRKPISPAKIIESLHLEA